MLSASTARLLDGAAALGEPEMVRIKGADEAVVAQRLLGMEERDRLIERVESNLVGSALGDVRRCWRPVGPGSRGPRCGGRCGEATWHRQEPGLVREVAAMAATLGVEVFTAFCESHTSQVPFHAVARLLRAATGVDGLDPQTARDRVRDRIPEADPEDVLLLR